MGKQEIKHLIRFLQHFLAFSAPKSQGDSRNFVGTSCQGQGTRKIYYRIGTPKGTGTILSGRNSTVYLRCCVASIMTRESNPGPEFGNSETPNAHPLVIIHDHDHDIDSYSFKRTPRTNYTYIHEGRPPKLQSHLSS